MSLSESPKYAYRRASNIKSKIAPSKTKSQGNNKHHMPKQLTLIPLIGIIIIIMIFSLFVSHFCSFIYCLISTYIVFGTS